MKILFLRSTNASSHQLHSHTVRSTLACLLVLAFLLIIPVQNARSSDTTIYSFGTQPRLDGAVPKGSLTYVTVMGLGLLFGRTTTTTQSGDGIIFHFDPNNVTTSYSIDHEFTGNPDGENPRHDAMTPFNGQLYGTTLQGGTDNGGLLFSIGQNGMGYDSLKSFHKSVGDEPHSCFAVGGNLLYGMTASGGDHDGGVIFSFDPSTSTYHHFYSFQSETGHEPHGRPTLDPDGTTLYGMTRKGGSPSPSPSPGYGVVFKVDTSGNNYQVMHPFAGGKDDGATTDHGYLVQSGSVLYGMTTNGGMSNKGVIFSIMTDGSNFHVIYRFGTAHHDGKNPYGSLLLVGSQLYGTTANGGDNHVGTVFMINTDGSGYHKLHDFGGSKHDGAKPIDNVILLNGALYGMCTGGGMCNLGTIFKVPLN
jgi:uncharacterized repeat protein (TIGR03803 family)